MCQPYGLLDGLLRSLFYFVIFKYSINPDVFKIALIKQSNEFIHFTAPGRYHIASLRNNARGRKLPAKVTGAQ